jgi:hypothetical protein
MSTQNNFLFIFIIFYFFFAAAMGSHCTNKFNISEQYQMDLARWQGGICEGY